MPTPPTDLTRKLRLTDDTALDAWLMPFSHHSKITRSFSEYFDDARQSYYDKNMLIRLHNGNTLEIQNKTPDQNQTIYSFAVPFDKARSKEFAAVTAPFGLRRPQPFSFEGFLGSNALRSLVTLDILRKTYVARTVLITVDTITGLGTFLELRAKDSHSAVDVFIEEANKLTATLPALPFYSDYVTLALQTTNELSL